MKYRNLGSAGVKVSNLCLGAMTFGEADEKSFMHKVGSDEETAHAVLDRTVERGINFVDTADVYGQDGLSERVIGSTPSAVSLAWLLAKPQVTSVIFGARTVEQLDANLAAARSRAGYHRVAERVAKFCHGAAERSGPRQTRPDEENP